MTYEYIKKDLLYIYYKTNLDTRALVTYLLNHLFHGAESFLRSYPDSS
jgi:hypothetical protein